jgi:hypothetical protein
VKTQHDLKQNASSLDLISKYHSELLAQIVLQSSTVLLRRFLLVDNRARKII